MSALVQRAIQKSRERDPSVTAMALLCGARVLSTSDKRAGEHAFGEGVATADGLSLDFHHRGFILEEAVRLGTTADPIAAAVLFRRLPAADHTMGRDSIGTMLVQSLAQRGDFELAVELLEDLDCETDGAQAVVQFATDLMIQRRAMFAARERWRGLRNQTDTSRTLWAQKSFYYLFSQHWRKLDPGEQESWLDEILLAITVGPDHPARTRFGDHVELHSMRDANLFRILNVLRSLKSTEQVEEILRHHPNVDDAAKVYPLGMEDLLSQQRPVVAQGDKCGEGLLGEAYAGFGARGDRRSLDTMRAANYGDPSALMHLLTEAHHLYREDIDPDNLNLAPRVFWPSCHAYKVAMYYAGKCLGKDAELLLQEIPDVDFALLASIELEAGALGLPQHFGVRMGYGPPHGQRPR